MADGLVPTSSDPFGEFLQKAFLAGKVPGPEISAFNTVLDLLSPGAVAERAEIAQPNVAQQFQDLFGLSADETQQAIGQQFGLRTSPAQELKAGTETQKSMVDFMKNEATRLNKQRELEIKEQERIDRKEVNESLKTLREEQAESKKFMTNLRKDILAEKDPRRRRQLLEVLGVARQVPAPVLKKLLEDGGDDTLRRLLEAHGLDPGLVPEEGPGLLNEILGFFGAGEQTGDVGTSPQVSGVAPAPVPQVTPEEAALQILEQLEALSVQP
jgi:hypothetical protein